MKKQIMSIVLCVCMVLSLMPAKVYAIIEKTITIGGVAVESSDWYAKTDANGDVTTDGADSNNWNVHVVKDDTSATVTLKDAVIQNNVFPTHAIAVSGYDLEIVLEGTSNQIGTGCENTNGNAIYNIHGGNNINITGTGNLNIIGNYGVNINGTGDVTIDIDGDLSIQSKWQLISTSGKVTATAKSITMDGYGIDCFGESVSLTAKNGDVTVRATSDNGINGKNIMISAPNGGVSIVGTQYAIYNQNNNVSVSAKNDISLSGTVYAKTVSVISQTGNVTIDGHYQGIEGLSDSGSAKISAIQGDITLRSANYSNIISGSNGYELNISAGGKLDAQGSYGFSGYNNATIKADSVLVSLNDTGYGFEGGDLTITNIDGGNCSDVYISGGGGGRDAVNAFGNLNIKSDNVTIFADTGAVNAINCEQDVTVGDTGMIVGAISISGVNNIATGVVSVNNNGGDVTTSGLNLTTEPTEKTAWKAGNGYVAYNPETSTLTLNNATIDSQHATAIFLSGTSKTIEVIGTNNITTSDSNYPAIFLECQATIKGNGILNVTGKWSGIGCAYDLTILGGVTVNAKACCDYGIIVNNGKLTVDNKSKLITDCTIAPFCITDASATPKAQKDVISLPGLPSETQIKSLSDGGMTLWSLVPTGGTLGFTTSGNLTGAATGILTFAYTPPVPTPDPTPTYTPDPHDKTATTANIAEVAENLTDGDKLTIKPTTETKTVSGDVLKEIKGKNVEVKVEVADGIEWSFNGKDIPDGWDAKDINFNLDAKNSEIPADTLKDFTAGKQSKTLSLDYDGEFGFAMTLTVHIGYLNDGQYANIYYYNPETKAFEFKGTSKINGAGNADFDFEHASDYVILVSDKAATASDKIDTTTTTTTDETNPKTGNEIPAALVITSLAAVIIATKKKLVK